ncbi:Uncharacterized mitochondrial protein AtMg01250, partial [Striga hermonthica]
FISRVVMADFDQELSERLNKVALSVNEEKIFDIAQNDIKLSDDECNRSLFGKIVGDRPASWIGIKRAMSLIWKLNQAMEVKELCPNYFQFIFQNRDDMKKVASGTNWSFENQYLVLKEWDMNINSKHPSFRELNIWVQVQNILLNWISTEVGLKIGQAFHKVKNVVIATTGSHGGKILKLLVTLNVEESIPRMAKVRLGNQLVTVGFKYEKLINLCHYCRKIGHLDRACQLKMDDIRNNSLREEQYGDWLRAPDGVKGNPSSFSGSRSTPPPESPSHSDNNISQKASSSRGQANNQIIPSTGIIESPARSMGTPSVVSTTGNAAEMGNLEEANLQIVDANPMDLEKGELSSISEFTFHHESLPASQHHPLKSWKRTGTRLNRLLSTNDSPIIIDQQSKGKRIRQVVDSSTLPEDHDVQTQAQLKKQKTEMEKVGSVCNKLGFVNRMAIVDPSGLSGGLVLLWDSQVVVNQIICKNFFIAVEFQLHLIKADLLKAIISFFQSGNILKHWNHTVLSLIPKCFSPDNLSQFRPISLCTVIYKLISKILAQRLKSCLPCCISDLQAAFLEGRQITDNIIIAQEAFHFLNRHSSGPHAFMALKLDLVKAFDRVEWICLKKLMIHMGFHNDFVKLIMTCVTTTSFSFKINGSISGYVLPSRGIRQGDPLSPYLFLIVTELLTALVQHSISSGMLKGLKLSRNGPVLSHILFADGSLFFLKAGTDQAGFLMSILEKYRLFTGQTVNLQKSAVFFSRNTSDHLKRSICNALNNIVSHRSTKYLGLPLGIGRSKKQVFDYV